MPAYRDFHSLPRGVDWTAATILIGSVFAAMALLVATVKSVKQKVQTASRWFWYPGRLCSRSMRDSATSMLCGRG
jgi:hypothetical protein